MSPTAKQKKFILLLAGVLAGCATTREESPAVAVMRDAVLAGDLAKCKEVVALEPELIRAQDQSRRQAPLHWASFNGQREVVVWLLGQGVEVDVRDEFGSTPLSGAAYAGRTEIACLLLDHGADVNAPDEEGRAPLDLAAHQQQLETAKLLVARGARIEGGPSAMDPVVMFVYHANEEGVAWAFSKGARLPTKNLQNGWTALHWLARGASLSKEEALAINLSDGTSRVEERSARGVEDGKYLGVFRLLRANGAGLDVRDGREYTPLHVAVEADNLAIATALLDAGAEASPRGDNGYTPLHLAALRTRADMVRLLVAGGAELDAKDQAGFTALVTATRWGEGEAHVREMVESLVVGGADVNARTPGGGWGPAGDDGLTALQQAAESGYVSVMELLVEHGADVNLEFKDGRTPLYWAAREGHRDVVASLLAHGANVNARAKGRSALGVAREHGHREIVDLLLERGAEE